MSFWNCDKWISLSACWQGRQILVARSSVQLKELKSSVAPAKILGPVGNGLRNEHVENEHAGGLTALIQDTVIRILTPVSDIKGLPHLLPLDV